MREAQYKIWGIKGMRGKAWKDYREGRESMDFINKAPSHWMNVNVSDTGRLDEFFDHTGQKYSSIQSRMN
jgi:hypothetical protein